MITIRTVDEYFEQMFDLARRVHAALTEVDVKYRIVGGVAVFYTSTSSIRWPRV